MKKFNYKKELKEAKEWLARDQNRHFMYDMPIRKIEESLAGEPSLDSVGNLASQLGSLAFLFGLKAVHGATAAQDESACNWSVHLDYIRNSMRMRILRIEHPKGNGSIHSYEVHRHFTLLLGMGLVEEAIWLGQRIYDSIKRRMKHPVVWKLREISEAELDSPITSDDDPRNLNSESISGYNESPVCGFVLRMWLVLTGRRELAERLPDGVPQCGIYDALFVDWDHAEKLADAISAACDFHILRMKEDRRIPYDIAEFDMSPFRQIPFEILAYRNLRWHFGLETPFPSHPLLDSPFVKSLPEEITPSGDPLLARILEYSRKVLPEL